MKYYKLKKDFLCLKKNMILKFDFYDKETKDYLATIKTNNKSYIQIGLETALFYKDVFEELKNDNNNN